MTWAQRRKFYYITGVIVFILVFIVLPIILITHKPPTCFDGKQNQDEVGIDCGGVCVLFCPGQPIPLITEWSKYYKVADGVYSVLAYVNNPNIDAEADNVNYMFRLYNKDGVLLRQRDGHVFVPAGAKVAIFEPEMLTGNQIPGRLDFSFTSQPVWFKQVIKDTGLSISGIELLKEDTAPRLNFTLSNNTVEQIKKIEAVAIIYNSDGNTIAFSRTIIDSVNGQGAVNASYNWPVPFSEPYSRAEILLRVLK